MFLKPLLKSVRRKSATVTITITRDDEPMEKSPIDKSPIAKSPIDKLMQFDDFDTLNLSRERFGSITPRSRSPSMNEDRSFGEEFVVVAEKEYPPYTMEEWQVILSKSDLIPVEQHRLYASLQKGVPKTLRKEIWLFLAGVDDLIKENAAKGITYESLREKDCPDVHNIEKDIPRTFPDHEFFIESEAHRYKHLENVLRAYAVFDPEVGYSQGMNYLAGTLVHYMHSEGVQGANNDIEEERNAFWTFVHILQKQDWRGVYKENTPKLIELLDKLEVRIKDELPELYVVFKEHELIPACFSQCFLSLLFYRSPLKFAKRVLDMFLMIGDDIILDLVIRMLTLCQQDILEKTEIEDLYPFLRNHLVEFTFQKYEKEFKNLVTKHNVFQIIEYC